MTLRIAPWKLKTLENPSCPFWEFSHSLRCKKCSFRGVRVMLFRHHPHQPTRKNPTTFFPPPCWAKFHHKEHKVDPIHGMDLFSVVPWSEVRCSSWEFYWVRYLSPKKIPGTKTWRYKRHRIFLRFWGSGGSLNHRTYIQTAYKSLRILPF